MTESPHRTLNATRARQGRWGAQILKLMLFGIALVVLGFILAYFWQTGGQVTSPPGAQQRVNGQAVHAPPPPAVTRQNERS